VLGGILAWTGAATLAGLGTAFPGDGGFQQYLKYIYGDLAGFLAAWAWIVIVMPATLAILSIVFVESIYSALHPASHGTATGIQYKFYSVLVLVVMISLNSISTKISARLGNFFVVVKLASVGLLVLAGLVAALVHVADPKRDSGGGDWHRKGWFDARPSLNNGRTIDWMKVGSWEAFGYYSTALYAGLWAYAGWDKARFPISSKNQSPS
jgi:L-type amino acid transporter 9